LAKVSFPNFTQFLNFFLKFFLAASSVHWNVIQSYKFSLNSNSIHLKQLKQKLPSGWDAHLWLDTRWRNVGCNWAGLLAGEDNWTCIEQNRLKIEAKKTFSPTLTW